MKSLVISDYVSRNALGEACIMECSASGDCEPACSFWIQELGVKFTDIPLLREWIYEFGGSWDNDTPDNEICMVAFWIMCGDLRENDDDDYLFMH